MDQPATPVVLSDETKAGLVSLLHKVNAPNVHFVAGAINWLSILQLVVPALMTGLGNIPWAQIIQQILAGFQPAPTPTPAPSPTPTPAGGGPTITGH